MAKFEQKFNGNRKKRVYCMLIFASLKLVALSTFIVQVSGHSSIFRKLFYSKMKFQDKNKKKLRSNILSTFNTYVSFESMSKSKSSLISGIFHICSEYKCQQTTNNWHVNKYLLEVEISYWKQGKSRTECNEKKVRQE